MPVARTREGGRTHARKRIEAMLMRMAPGDALPPVRELMRQLAVSLGRLQEMLGQMEEDGLIERRPRQGNFKPSGQGLVQLSPFIDLIVVDSDPRQRPYHSSVVEALSARMSHDGRGLRLHRLSGDHVVEDAKTLLSRPDMRTCILLAMTASVVNAAFAHADVASVCLFPRHDPHAYECPCITTSEKVTKLQLEHLWSLGHTRIAFLDRYYGQSPVWSFLIRREAYYRMMSQQGLPVHPDWVPQVGSSDELVSQAMEQLFACDQLPTAVIASDVQLAAIYRFLAKRGLEVGKDISIVGTDDLADSQAMRPATTSVRNASSRAADLAIETLNRICGGQSVEHIQVIEPHLIVRDSTSQASVAH